MPSNHFILYHPFLLFPSIFPRIRVFSIELALSIRWPKYWNFSFSISPSNENSGLISFRVDWFDLLAVQATLTIILVSNLTYSAQLIPVLLKVKVKSLSPVWLFVTPWTVTHQTPQSMEFSRQEYWSGLPLPSPGDLPNPGTEPGSPALQADALPSEPPGKPPVILTLFRIISPTYTLWTSTH